VEDRGYDKIEGMVEEVPIPTPPLDNNN